jgi:hypothetical protein
LVTVTVEAGVGWRSGLRALIGGLGGELAAYGGDVGEASLASALVEPELKGELGHRQQAELLGCGCWSLTRCHSAIVSNGCDTVVA